MIDGRYFNKYGVLVAISSIVIILLLLDKGTYDDFVESPSHLATKTTSRMLFQTAIYFVHIKLGKIGIFSVLIMLALLGTITGFDWYRFFDRNK